jgi:hypothetical protein
MFLDSFGANIINRSDILPPTSVPLSVKKKMPWQMAMLDGYERIGLKQFQENLIFNDYYRMIDGKMSYQELKEVIPQMDKFEDLMDGVGIPTFLKHYDIMGVIINALVGKLISFQNKYHITDIGEVSQNEFLRYKTEEIQKVLTAVIDNEVKMHLAESGLNPEGRQFNSPEEQQQFMQQLEQEKAKLIPQETEESSKNTFKTIGTKFGEAVLEKDRLGFRLEKFEKNEFKDYLTTGRCFREYKIGFDKYYPKTWSPINTFFSKEVDADSVHKGEYVGRVHIYTPQQCVDEYGHRMNASQIKELLGGNTQWKDFLSPDFASGSLNEAVRSNFLKVEQVSFAGYSDYNFALGLEDALDIPMGIETRFGKDGSTYTRENFLPRMEGSMNAGTYSNYARILRDDFEHRKDLALVTEVYAKVSELFGYLTYTNDYGRLVTEEVTEEILNDFIKENNLKVDFKQTLEEAVTSFEENTIKWVRRSVVYEGVKIQSGNLKEPMYLYFRPMEHQIKGEGLLDVYLPVAGKIGKGIAGKIFPYQAKYNLCMNQIYNLLEKEIGMFFLLDVTFIPSEYAGWGDPKDALHALREVAKETGILPIATTGDSEKNRNHFNAFSTHDISFTNQIAHRIQVAEFCQRKAYETIGLNPQALSQPSEYATAEGVKLGQESMFAQVAELYEDFEEYNLNALELHLSVAQYCQANKKDPSIYYTKSDASLAYLKVVDPDLPFRKLGLLPLTDSRSRKQVETYRQLLMSNNTIATDTLEIAKLFSSTTMAEMIEVARLARISQQKLEQEKFERDNQLLDKQRETLMMQDQKKWEREEASRKEDRDNKIQVAAISAQGRAADKQADDKSFKYIEAAENRAMKENSFNKQYEQDAEDLRMKDQRHKDEMDLKWEKLKLEAEKIAERRRATEASKFVAAINPG